MRAILLLLTVYRRLYLSSLKMEIWFTGLIAVITCVSHLILLSVVRIDHFFTFRSFVVAVFVIESNNQIFLFYSIGSDFYVCDFKGHCVAVFGQDGSFKYRIGNEKITCFPNGIDISDAGDILIGDSHGNRFHVACFSREGVLQSEFECPHVKVGFMEIS